MTGQLLGHYRVLEKIGSGGMGEVYRATDDRLGRDVAIKILQASLATDSDRLRRFEQEARAAAALNHPNIVAVYDVGMHEGSPYIVSEQLRGKSVDHRSDIFSFGTVLYEMLAGHRAFSGETEVDTITAVLREDPPEIRLGGNDVPAAFEQIVRHCLEKEPDNRFQSARDLAFALNTVSDVPSGRHMTFLGWSSWLPRWASLLIAALVAVAVGLLGGAILKPAHNPVYRRLTFERGTIYSARFTPDGRSVVYGASWNGQPLQLYSTLPDSLL